jgi:CHASE2 domain-containing sensor protein
MIKYVLFVSICFLQCKEKKAQVEEVVHVKEVAVGTNTDPEIVLFNIGDGDRAEIADLLAQLEQCSPSIIGIDAVFLRDGDPLKDSALEQVLSDIKNDVLAYRFDSTGKLETPIRDFSVNAKEEGFINLERENGLSNHFTPIIEKTGVVYESFALKVIKLWKPSFNLSIIPNKSVPIRFKRSQEDFHCFEKPNLKESKVREFLSKKIVLVGYLGPSLEDKHFTPLRSKLKVQNGQPDTYGVVIIANEIRTLLEYYNAE